MKKGKLFLLHKIQDLSVSKKIIALVATAVIIPLILTTMLTTWKLSDLYEVNRKQNEQTVISSIEKDLEAKTKALKEEGSLIASSEQVKASILQKNRLMLNQYIARIAGDMGLNSITICGTDGKTISRSDRISLSGEDVSRIKSYRAALMGNVDALLDNDGGKLEIIAYAPIKAKVNEEEQTIGTVLLKRWIREKDMDAFGNKDLRASVIGMDGKRIGSGLKTAEDRLMKAKKTLKSKNGTVVGTILIEQDATGFLKAKNGLIRDSIIINTLITGLVLFFGVLLIQSIVKPLKSLKINMLESAKGNLSIRTTLRQRDEIGLVSSAFDHMQESLSKLIHLVRKNIGLADQTFEKTANTNQYLRGVIEEIGEVSFHIENMSQEQKEKLAAARDHVRSGLLEIYEITGETAKIAELSESVNELADKNNGHIQLQIAELGALLDDFEGTNRNLGKTSEELVKINHVVELVKEFASSTKLLAFNATIEAARAGDAGKGFAVVAKEITRLSTEVSSSIGGVEDTVNELVRELEKDAKSVSSSVEKLKALTGKMEGSKEDMERVKREMQQVRDRSVEIRQVLARHEEKSRDTEERMEAACSQLDTFTSYSAVLREAAGKTKAGVKEMSHSMGELMESLKAAESATGKFRIPEFMN